MSKLIAAALTAVTLTAGGSAYAGDQDFWLVNHSGRTIAQAIMSAASSRSIGDDVLGRSVLPDGRKTYIEFSPETASCYWDLIVVFRDGDVAGDRYNLCGTTRVTVR